ncbi:hypothetical protein PLICRDRAFT_49330 [Plicaturopsis crispa FD-325 SS-3]|nr:hypothetical protein PLICRDRAFT_49330 [Plicaturopsis crispa FD-325 SS-3]
MPELDDPDEHWSDAPETADDEHSLRGDPMEVQETAQPGDQEQDLTVRGIKITGDESKTEMGPPSLGTIGANSPLSAQEQIDPSASVHSLPAVHVSEPTSPPRRPSTARAPQDAENATSTSRTHISADGGLSATERRSRHRSGIDPRSSNRLSGFFSNFLHRRDNPPMPQSRSTLREEQEPPTSPVVGSAPRSRSTSPAPTRPSTPPPQLPAPTLNELGLSLSVLTSDLSPSHFSTPPTSGAFLGPHYLLLCHVQGLDVLPLVSPPALQPYALVRRVSFKSVVVMEQRGVLVAIAGRRDGVRVYALEEIKKAVEWRLDVEIRRERERARREEAKKTTTSLDRTLLPSRDSAEKKSKARLSTSPTPPSPTKGKAPRKSSTASTNSVLVPRTPTTPRKPKPSQPPPQSVPVPPIPPIPTDETAGRPPPYTTSATRLRSQTSIVELHRRGRAGSVSEVMAGAPPNRRSAERSSRPRNEDTKTDDWVEARGNSDDEAIDIVAAGPSGGEALDERTSARGAAPPVPGSPIIRTEALPASSRPRPLSQGTRRNRPANLDLSLTNSQAVVPSEPSPTPTLMTLRQALSHPQGGDATDPDTPRDFDEDTDGAHDGTGDELTLAQALMESRIPDLPPAGSRRSQQPILITASHSVVDAEAEPASPRSSDVQSSISASNASVAARRRRRWSVNLFANQTTVPETTVPNATSLADSSGTTLVSAEPPVASTSEGDTSARRLARSNSAHSHVSTTSAPTPARPATSASSAGRRARLTENPPPVPPMSHSPTSSNHSHSRFFARMISNAFHTRRSEDQSQTLALRNQVDAENSRNGGPAAGHAAPPKLEYVKLPGTKGALLVKAVETPKKSFLAILCGENGEKVELFAGTYRTALGLSRTFILPDSPRSLELQLQGDDLVEVFLVFSQNVFGLEPATVRVREVRIGRAERRAARRRARELRVGDAAGDTPGNAEEDANVNVSIGVSVAASADVLAPGTGRHPADSAAQPAADPPVNAMSNDAPAPQTIGESLTANALAPHAEELVALATAQMGPYTTFQQLSFAPNFPLASIADEYIIPPTYPSFLDYRTEHEPEVNGDSNVDLAQIQFSPPGLPVPAASPPSKWFYRDPKGLVHGPWKASLMQSWYKDGLLPPDLPVRREEDTDYVLLKVLRLQSVDPTHPFRSPPPPLMSEPLPLQETSKPLLEPISLLSQPKHFGPPALFFSSRGGHSTTIVDARGRSVLKGRFVWSPDDQDDDDMPIPLARMGDVKRLEAFDVKERSVLVALRQGGLEAVDLGDALLKPADESRTVLPQFSPPPSNINRRSPFVWKIGTPVSSSPTSFTALSARTRGGQSVHKKLSTGPGKSPGRTDFTLSSDADADNPNEVLFLGRKGDEIYLCERIAGSFRLLRLRPSA